MLLYVFKLVAFSGLMFGADGLRGVNQSSAKDEQIACQACLSIYVLIFKWVMQVNRTFCQRNLYKMSGVSEDLWEFHHLAHTDNNYTLY